MQYVIFIIIAQAAYSIGDVIRKLVMHGQPFGFGLLRSVPFVFSFLVSIAAFLLQLYVLKNYDLSKTIVILACAAVVISAILGIVVFHEKINGFGWAGVGFAVLAVIMSHLG
jgi:multidrug transporter EmrE-like cation transporter